MISILGAVQRLEMSSDNNELLLRAQRAIDALTADLREAVERGWVAEREGAEARAANAAALQREGALTAALAGLQTQLREEQTASRKQREEQATLRSALQLELEACQNAVSSLRTAVKCGEEAVVNAEDRATAAESALRHARHALVEVEHKRTVSESRQADSERIAQDAAQRCAELQAVARGNEDAAPRLAAVREELMSTKGRALHLERQLTEISSRAEVSASSLAIVQSHLDEAQTLARAAMEDRDALLIELQNHQAGVSAERNHIASLVMSWLRLLNAKFAGVATLSSSGGSGNVRSSSPLRTATPLAQLAEILGVSEHADLPQMLSRVTADVDTLPYVREWFEKAVTAFEAMLLERMRRMVSFAEDLARRLGRIEEQHRSLRSSSVALATERHTQLAATNERLQVAELANRQMAVELSSREREAEGLSQEVETLTRNSK